MRRLEAQFRSRHTFPEVISLEINISNVDHSMNGEQININPWRLSASRIRPQERRNSGRKMIQSLSGNPTFCSEDIVF